jgi:hypothetical protein
MNADIPHPSTSAGADPVQTPPVAPAESAPAELPLSGGRGRLLEARLKRLEIHLGFGPLTDADAEAILSGAMSPQPDAGPMAEVAAEDGGLEMEIGEFWLARIGMIALMIGLGFLVAYPFAALPAWVPSLIGFVASAVFFWMARRWERSQPEMTRLLFWGSLFLCYFATLRLHFFAKAPLLASRELTLGLLLLVLAGEYAVALRRKSQLTTALVTLLGFVTVIISDSVPVALSLVVLMAVLAVWLVRLQDWLWHGALTAGLAFLLHLLLLAGNPLAGHPVHAIGEPQANLLFLALYALAFAATGFLPGTSDRNDWLRIAGSLGLSGGVLLVGFMNVYLFQRTQLPWIELLMAAGFLVAAIAGWWHHASRYATAVYACAGYLTLTIFLVSYFPAPTSYGWLAWQGLLVAATAVWFRSKIMVVANVFIFAGIYAYYLLIETASGPVNLSFAVVALLTARVLNWQSERLDLHTGLIRNFYLGAATVAVPYGLYHTVPPGWVSTSWLLAAGVYFGVSIMLHNRKYRWMAMATVFATVAYVFIFDLARLTPAYRILSFLVLGVALVVISLSYGRSRRRNGGGG